MLGRCLLLGQEQTADIASPPEDEGPEACETGVGQENNQYWSFGDSCDGTTNRLTGVGNATHDEVEAKKDDEGRSEALGQLHRRKLCGAQRAGNPVAPPDEKETRRAAEDESYKASYEHGHDGYLREHLPEKEDSRQLDPGPKDVEEAGDEKVEPKEIDQE